MKDTKKLKILVLSHISDLAGGAEMSMLDLFDYWNDHYKIEPEFIMREPVKALATALKERGWKYHSLRYTFWSDGVPPTNPEDIFQAVRYNSKAIREIEAIINVSNPDVVMTNSVIAPWAALAAYFRKVPHVWFVREYGDLDHGRIFEIGRENTLQDVGNLSDLVVTNSKTLAGHIQQYIDPKKLTTLYTPFKLKDISRRATAKTGDPFKNKESLKLVITGSLAASKGQLEAVNAVGMLNAQGYDTEICIIGKEGAKEYNGQLDDAISKYDIAQKVHFVGFQTNPLAYLSLADIGIMASRKEAFGRVTFEYLAVGKAVVGANSGATPEMVKDGYNGYLYDQGDTSSLVDALMHYAKDRSLISKHGLAAKAEAEKMMQGDLNADALFKKVIQVINNAPNVDRRPINFLHRWLDYTDVAQKCIDDAAVLSMRRLAKIKLRQTAKGVYYRLRSAKTKLIGR